MFVYFSPPGILTTCPNLQPLDFEATSIARGAGMWVNNPHDRGHSPREGREFALPSTYPGATLRRDGFGAWPGTRIGNRWILQDSPLDRSGWHGGGLRRRRAWRRESRAQSPAR